MGKFSKILFLPIISLGLTVCGCESNNTDADKFGKINFRIHNYHPAFDESTTKDGSFKFDYRNFVDADPTKYQKSLAQTAILLCSETYPWLDINVKEKGEYLTDKTLFEYLKVKDIEFLSVSPDDYEHDKNDLSYANCGHYEFTYNNQRYQIMFTVIYGTIENCEWFSNFDIGPAYDYTNYITDAEPRTEWEHRRHHKGFDVGFNRIKVKIDDYYSKHVDDECEQIYFVCGHSRGASIANLFGAYLTDKNLKNFTYTFGCSNVTDADLSYKEKEGLYNNIFNIMNIEDPVAYVPPADYKFRKYGQSIEISCKKYRDEWNEFCVGREYNYIYADKFVDVFRSVIASRDDLYILSDEKYTDSALEFDNEYDATDAYILVNNYILANYDMSNHIEIDVPVKEGEKWVIKWRYAPALLLDILSLTANMDFRVAALYLPYFAGHTDILKPFVVEVAAHGLDSFGLPHMPESYWILANKI